MHFHLFATIPSYQRVRPLVRLVQWLRRSGDLRVYLISRCLGRLTLRLSAARLRFFRSSCLEPLLHLRTIHRHPPALYSVIRSPTVPRRAEQPSNQIKALTRIILTSRPACFTQDQPSHRPCGAPSPTNDAYHKRPREPTTDFSTCRQMPFHDVVGACQFSVFKKTLSCLSARLSFPCIQMLRR